MDTIQTPDAAKMPMLVVDRSPRSIAERRPSGLRRVLRAARIVPPALLMLMAGGIIGVYFEPPGLQKLMALLKLEPGAGAMRRVEPNAPAAPVAPRVVLGLGELLPNGDVVTIAPPYGSGDARIASLGVKEGDRVAAGSVLAILDNERALKAAVEAARASAAAKDASLKQAREAALASRDESRAGLARSEAALFNAKREFDRVEELRRKGFAADATYDAKRAAYDQSAQDVARAKATLSRYAFEDVNDQADVLVAAGALASAQADLARAEAELDKAYVRAPMDGVALTIHARPGEKPGAQGVMTFGDIDDMTAEIEVYQTSIGAVSEGASVALSADALPKPLHGRVVRIGLEVGRQTITDADPAANTDARVVKVYVDLEPDSAAVARRFTNLQVTARIAVAADGQP